MGALSSLMVHVCGGGEAWRIMGLPPAPPTHTNWFGHPCTRLALLGELAWSGHQVGQREWAYGVLCWAGEGHICDWVWVAVSIPP